MIQIYKTGGSDRYSANRLANNEASTLTHINYGTEWAGTIMGVNKVNLSRTYIENGEYVIDTVQNFNITIGTNDKKAMVIDTEQNVVFENNITASDTIRIPFGVKLGFENSTGEVDWCIYRNETGIVFGNSGSGCI